MTDSKTLKGRRYLLLAAAVFAAPVLGAMALYYFAPQMAPSATTNYGTLISPPRPLPDNASVTLGDGGESKDPLRGKWTLLHQVEGECDQLCSGELILTRQIHQALAHKQPRVRRVVLATEELVEALDDQLASEHPKLTIAQPNAALREAVGEWSDQILLLDPLGNIMMRYRATHTPEGVQADFKGIRKDIKKLLRVSTIG